MLPHESGFPGLRLYDWRREGQVQEIAAVILIRKLETNIMMLTTYVIFLVFLSSFQSFI